MVAMVSPCRFVTAHEVRLGAEYPFVYRTPPGRVTYRSAALDDPVDPVDGDTLERRRPRWLIAADGDDRRVTPSPSGRAIDAHLARFQRTHGARPEARQRLAGGVGGAGRQRHRDRGSPRARTPDRDAHEGDGESEQGGIPAGAGVPPQGASRATAQMCTTVHVSVRVMPGTSWMRAMTNLPSSSTVEASTRAITS